MLRIVAPELMKGVREAMLRLSVKGQRDRMPVLDARPTTAYHFRVKYVVRKPGTAVRRPQSVSTNTDRSVMTDPTPKAVRLMSGQSNILRPACVSPNRAANM